MTCLMEYLLWVCAHMCQHLLVSPEVGESVCLLRSRRCCLCRAVERHRYHGCRHRLETIDGRHRLAHELVRDAQTVAVDPALLVVAPLRLERVAAHLRQGTNSTSREKRDTHTSSWPM